MGRWWSVESIGEGKDSLVMVIILGHRESELLSRRVMMMKSCSSYTHIISWFLLFIVISLSKAVGSCKDSDTYPENLIRPKKIKDVKEREKEIGVN